MLVFTSCTIHVLQAYPSSDPIPTSVMRLSEPIEFDGVINDNAWDNIEPLKLTTQTPVFGSPPSERTEIKLAYDLDYLYLSGKMYVKDISTIFAKSKKRDALTVADWFGIIIDSYNDKQNALAFFTTPAGLRMDAAVLNDASSRMPLNLSWNNFWDVKVSEDEHGWYAEMRIPWTSLQFQPIDGKVIMGITVWRYSVEHNEVYICPAISPDFGEMSGWRPSQAKEYQFDGIEAKKPFYITPYVLAGRSTVKSLNGIESNYETENKIERELGLDVKYGISNNWTLDLSLNTDFAQVEADNQQVNLTRFSLFFPEKRLFFQERSGIFNFTFSRGDQLFYSRRIGIDDDGNPVRILGGARITGRSGPWDVGFLNMQTASFENLDSENFMVGRLQRQVINENSTAGLLFTNRTNFDGSYNSAIAADASIRLFKETFYTLKWAQVADSDSGNRFFDFDAQKIWMFFSNRSQRGFTYGTSLQTVGKDFEPEMGFERRQNYFREGHRYGYRWFPDSESPIFTHGPQFSGETIWNRESWDLETLGWGLSYSVDWKNSRSIELSYRPQYELLYEPFELSDDAIIPVGSYRFDSFRLEYSTNQTKSYFAEVEMNIGEFYDGYRTGFSVAPTASISASLEMAGTYEYNNISFDSRNQNFQVHLLSLNALYMYSTKLSLSALVQYNSEDKKYFGNVRFRYNPKEGVDLFIVYNDLLNTDLNRVSPNLPRSTERTILLKYSYTFRL